MKAEQYLAIRRDDRFSPNSVEADRLILQVVCDEVRRAVGLDEPIMVVDEAVFARNPQLAGTYISMARSEEALLMLEEMERRGCKVVNTPTSVRRCQRSLLDDLMRAHGISMPPSEGTYGYWLKRGDASAQSETDVVFCADGKALDLTKQEFRARGIDNMVVSAHVPGDLVKFYGVGTRMFRYFYPSDDGISKFGDEHRNGKAHHYDFDRNALQQEVIRLAEMTGVEVYGGDAIVDSEGKYYIIDFNDWPSFSRCREEAARAIAQEMNQKGSPDG